MFFFGLQAIITLPTKVTKGSNVVCSNFDLSSKRTTLGLYCQRTTTGELIFYLRLPHIFSTCTAYKGHTPASKPHWIAVWVVAVILASVGVIVGITVCIIYRARKRRSNMYVCWLDSYILDLIVNVHPPKSESHSMSAMKFYNGWPKLCIL